MFRFTICTIFFNIYAYIKRYILNKEQKQHFTSFKNQLFRKMFVKKTFNI